MAVKQVSRKEGEGGSAESTALRGCVCCTQYRCSHWLASRCGCGGTWRLPKQHRCERARGTRPIRPGSRRRRSAAVGTKVSARASEERSARSCAARASHRTSGRTPLASSGSPRALPGPRRCPEAPVPVQATLLGGSGPGYRQGRPGGVRLLWHARQAVLGQLVGGLSRVAVQTRPRFVCSPFSLVPPYRWSAASETLLKSVWLCSAKTGSKLKAKGTASSEAATASAQRSFGGCAGKCSAGGRVCARACVCVCVRVCGWKESARLGRALFFFFSPSAVDAYEREVDLGIRRRADAARRLLGAGSKGRSAQSRSCAEAQKEVHG